MISKPDYIAGAILVVEAFLQHSPSVRADKRATSGLADALVALRRSDPQAAYAEHALTYLRESDLPPPVRGSVIARYILLTQ